ncbi:unnamed protein product [marine sediment metagenome]|uniref:Uncharacterized protein n=1 Tax=marine sediment metagenome TaxID=412755 RepID=X1AGD3_9ZZZZ
MSIETPIIDSINETKPKIKRLKKRKLEGIKIFETAIYAKDANPKIIIDAPA